jgi:UDP-3-O-[3-hydroxymyristoyl] glucosamine N-acyltransferase
MNESVINAGVRIGDAITVGSMSCVSSSLSAPGMYLSQRLRMVPLDYQQSWERHPQVHVAGLQDRVVNKHAGAGR